MVTVTFELMDMIQDAKDVETVAFIKDDAISGAALVALACDKIVMRPDALIGDAGEIVMGADGAFRYVEAKGRSPVAQKARDAAEATGRPLSLAEKMTDKDMVVFRAVNKQDGTIRYFSDKEWVSMEDTDDWEKGKPIREAGKEMFFTANGKRAVELGMADHLANNQEELAELLKRQNADSRHATHGSRHGHLDPKHRRCHVLAVNDRNGCLGDRTWCAGNRNWRLDINAVFRPVFLESISWRHGGMVGSHFVYPRHYLHRLRDFCDPWFWRCRRGRVGTDARLAGDGFTPFSDSRDQ